jgi:hypothetical protein
VFIRNKREERMKYRIFPREKKEPERCIALANLEKLHA